MGLAEPASLRVSLQFYHLQGDLTLALVDEAGRLLDDLVALDPLVIEGQSTSSDECVLEDDAPAGTYRVRVTGADPGIAAPYRLEVTTVSDEGEGCP